MDVVTHGKKVIVLRRIHMGIFPTIALNGVLVLTIKRELLEVIRMGVTLPVLILVVGDHVHNNITFPPHLRGK